MYEYELVGAAVKLLRDMFDVQPGESVVITADTESSMDVVKATAQAACVLGAKPLVAIMASPRGVGKAADPDLPMEPLTEMLKAADVWIEYNNEWLLYSTPFDRAVAANAKLRYMCLVGMNPDLMMRNIGRVNVPLLREFLIKTTELTKAAKHVRVTTPTGTDVEFDHVPGREFYTADGFVPKGTFKMMPGQISWSPDFESINGTIVFDGSVVPPIGILREPIKLTVEKGVITKIEGGQEARQLEAWLKNWNHPQMLRLAHISYGFNPGAKLTGDIVEDERVWGATEWGIGNVGPQLVSDIPGGIEGPSHTDGICLNSSVWLDGELFLKDGEVVGPPELKALADQLRK